MPFLPCHFGRKLDLQTPQLRGTISHSPPGRLACHFCPATLAEIPINDENTQSKAGRGSDVLLEGNLKAQNVVNNLKTSLVFAGALHKLDHSRPHHLQGVDTSDSANTSLHHFEICCSIHPCSSGVFH
jgi:hypothetical protein